MGVHDLLSAERSELGRRLWPFNEGVCSFGESVLLGTEPVEDLAVLAADIVLLVGHFSEEAVVLACFESVELSGAIGLNAIAFAVGQLLQFFDVLFIMAELGIGLQALAEHLVEGGLVIALLQFHYAANVYI